MPGASGSVWAPRRREYLFRSSVTVAVLAASFGVINALEGYPAVVAIGGVTFVLSLLSLWLVRRGASATVVGHLLTFASCLNIWGSLYAYGGLRSADYSWVVLAPAVALLLAGLRAGVIWTLVSIVLTWLLAGLHVAGLVPDPDPTDAAILAAAINGTGSVVAMASLVYGFYLATLRAEQRAQEVIGALDAEVIERARAQREAQLALAARSRFLALMSHEIRTPVNGVLGIGRLLLRTELDPEQRRLLETSVGAGETLLAVLNDVLDFSRNESGELVIAREPMSLHALVQETTALYRAAAEEKGLVIDAVLEGEADWVLGDAIRLRQVIGNLVNNAVKFTARGRICVVLRSRGEQIELAVQDTGIGIAPEARERLFEAFTQADSSTVREFGGTGLGLAICRQIVTSMDGIIEVDSALGQGSTFTVRLSLPATEPVLEDLASEDTRDGGLRILVAEDNDANRILIDALLRLAGHEPVLVADGVEAVQRAGDGFDVVLMDLRMPRMDGLEATRRIRSTLGTELPIIALTANVMDEDRRACLDAGVNDFVPKPFRPEELWKALARCTTPTP